MRHTPGIKLGTNLTNKAWSVFISFFVQNTIQSQMDAISVSVSQVMVTPLNLLLNTSSHDDHQSFSSPRPWLYVAQSEIVAENNDGSCTILWLASLARIPSRLALSIYHHLPGTHWRTGCHHPKWWHWIFFKCIQRTRSSDISLTSAVNYLIALSQPIIPPLLCIIAAAASS